MMRPSLAVTVAVGGLAAIVVAAPAAAQSVVETVESSVVEGPGHELSEGTVIHPHLSLETGVVNNLFYEADDPVTTAVARAIVGVSIASQNAPKPSGTFQPGVVTENTETEEEIVDEAPTPSRVDFRLGAMLMLIGYPTSNDRARDQSDFALGVDGQVVVNPAGDFLFAASDQFLRDAQPRNFESFGSLNRDYNHLNLGVMYQPGGHALGVGVRYENTLDRFESDDSAFANRLQHTIGLRAEYRYLPITKFYLDASYGFFGALGDAGMGYKSDSNPLRIELGIGTALTWATTLIAHLGYANGFYDTGESFNFVVGGVQFGYRYSQYGRLQLIADYDFQDSLQANYFRDATFKAVIDHQLGLLVLGADAGIKLRSYQGIPAVLGEPTRDDVLLAAGAHGAYVLRDNFAITARADLLIDSTDYMAVGGDSPEFTRFEAVVGATVAF